MMSLVEQDGRLFKIRTLGSNKCYQLVQIQNFSGFLHAFRQISQESMCTIVDEQMQQAGIFAKFLVYYGWSLMNNSTNCFQKSHKYHCICKEMQKLEDKGLTLSSGGFRNIQYGSFGLRSIVIYRTKPMKLSRTRTGRKAFKKAISLFCLIAPLFRTQTK